MNKRPSNGKQPFLPRVKSSYRQLQRKLIPITCWVTALFLLAGNASAAYTPANVADLLSVARPIMQIKTQLPQPPANPPASPTTATTSPTESVATMTDQPADKRAPEITMEIKAAEYIPPAPKPFTRTALSTN